MRLLTWNLNHRAARRRIPAWIPAAVGAQQPQVAVLTEYVQGDAHDGFVAELANQGLRHWLVSDRAPRQNQILIASETPLLVGPHRGPGIHPAVPPNTLHALVPDTGLHILACRIPAFARQDRALKRATWEWLLGAAQRLEAHSSAVTGDLNTALGDAASDCGDLLPVLSQRGWQHAIPGEGWSWKSRRSAKGRRIDHTFLTPSMAPARATYVWDFEGLAPDAGSGTVGIPDHAMLIVDF